MPPKSRAYITSGTTELHGDQVFLARDPAVTDTSYETGTRWTNTDTNIEFFLKAFTSTNNVTQATWVAYLDASGSILQVTPSSGTVVTPTLGNINLNGSGDITVTGAGDTLTIADSGAGSDVNTLTGDSGGAVGPTANNISLLSTLSSTFDANCVRVVGNPGTSTLTITTHNTLTGTAAGAGPTVLTPIIFALGTTSAYRFETRMIVFDSAASEAAGYDIFGTIRTDGATATLVALNTQIIAEEGNLATGIADMVVSVNDMQITYTVPAASTVSVFCKTTYVKAT